MAKQVVLILLSVCLSFSVVSQTKVVKRIEFDQLDKYENLSVLNISNQGTILFYKSIKSEKSQFSWNIDHYSTNLDLIKTHQFFIQKKFKLIRTIQNETNSFFYFENDKSEFQLYRLHHESQKFDKIVGETPRKTSQHDFLIDLNKLIIYYSSTREHMCKVVDFDANKDIDIAVNLPGYSALQFKLSSLGSDDVTNELFFVLDAKNEKGRVLCSYHYDFNGNFLKTFDISALSDKYLFGPVAKKLENGTYSFIGKYASNAYNTTNDNGIYHANLSDTEILFYSQLRLQDLQLFSRNERHHKMGDSYEHGSTDRLDFSVHEIISTDQGFFITCEFFYPVYESNLGLAMMFGMAGTIASYRLTGYEYIGAEMIGFNWSGEKLWDVPLELKLNERPNKRKFEVEVNHVSNDFIIKHPHKSIVRTIVLNENGDVLSQEEMKLEEPLKLEFWHDKYYISYDKFYIYTVHNKQSAEDRVTTKREVFFIEKLIAE